MDPRLATSLEGRYTIDREIGRGGMATVYLARDVRHNRNVALKVLNPELGAVLGVERFLAEIQVTANLQHPNLLPLFDSGEANGLLFYVMPHVEGESLRVRLEREKQLPVDEAVRIATAIAEALDYAHQQKVIHRDLKPENVLLQAGQPVVADFGIALAVSKAGGARITQTGLSLGTPQYMSPEQATGDRVVDARTDIYSLAAVTYEMLTGEPPHIGSTSQAIIARVLTEKPRSIRVSRPNVPRHVEAAVERGLEKLPADRFSSAHEFGEALQGRRSAAATDEGLVPGSVWPGAAPGERGARDVSLRGRLVRMLSSPLWAAAFVFVALLALWEARGGAPGEAPVTTRFALALPAGTRIPPNIRYGHVVAISPDGRSIVYTHSTSAGSSLMLRAAGQLESRPIPGTDGAAQPCFSPDGAWIAFVVGSQLKKVSLDGTAVVPLADVGGTSNGAAWTPDGRIVVSLGSRLVTVSASGGPARTLSQSDSGSSRTLRWPVALDDGRTVLVSAWAGTLSASRLVAVSLDDGATTDLDIPGNSPLGVVDGNLIYASGTGAIMAIPFDTRRVRKTSDSPVLVLDGVSIAVSGAARAALSASGSLVYQTGGGAQEAVLADAKGNVRPIIRENRVYTYPRYAPDGRRIAVSVASGSSTDIHIYDVSTGTLTRLTTEGETNDRPEWTSDGRHVLFRTDRVPGTNSLFWQPVDGSGPATQLVAGTRTNVWEGVTSPDGRALVYRTGTTGAADIWVRSLTGDTTSRPFVQTPFTEFSARFSPDGKWVAYSSDESGAGHQVYVRPFPGPGPRVQVSVSGGENPIWARDGRRLFYARDQQVIVATLTLSPTFAVTAQQPFVEGDYTFFSGHASYDVSPDGRELLLLRPVGGVSPIIVAQGWKHELRERLAGKPVK